MVMTINYREGGLDDDHVRQGDAEPDSLRRAGRNFHQIHRENQTRIREAQAASQCPVLREKQERIWEARMEAEGQRLRDEGRERMRAHRGKTAETVRPYVKLDGLTPEEKKARKQEQDREARRRYNAKPGRVLSDEEQDFIDWILADLELTAREPMSPEQKRENRRLQQLRYRAKKRAARKQAEASSTSD